MTKAGELQLPLLGMQALVLLNLIKFEPLQKEVSKPLIATINTKLSVSRC